MFSEKKMWGMEIHFVERKQKGDFGLQLAIPEWGKEGARYKYRKFWFVGEEHWENNFICGPSLLKLD